MSIVFGKFELFWNTKASLTLIKLLNSTIILALPSGKVTSEWELFSKLKFYITLDKCNFILYISLGVQLSGTITYWVFTVNKTSYEALSKLNENLSRRREKRCCQQSLARVFIQVHFYLLWNVTKVQNILIAEILSLHLTSQTTSECSWRDAYSREICVPGLQWVMEKSWKRDTSEVAN